MQTTLQILEPIIQWFIEINDLLADNAPNPDDTTSIINTIEHNYKIRLQKVIGNGDNGIAVLTDQGTVIKITIDTKEATLWNKLIRVQIPGLIHCYGVNRLAKKHTQDYDVYVIHTEFAPKPLDNTLAELIVQTNQLALRRRQKNRISNWQGIVQNLIVAYQQAANEDERLSDIVDLLTTLGDVYHTAIFDLHPDNFRMTKDNRIVLIDPSIPKFGGQTTLPRSLFFETALERVLTIVFNMKKLYIGANMRLYDIAESKSKVITINGIRFWPLSSNKSLYKWYHGTKDEPGKHPEVLAKAVRFRDPFDGIWTTAVPAGIGRRVGTLDSGNDFTNIKEAEFIANALGQLPGFENARALPRQQDVLYNIYTPDEYTEQQTTWTVAWGEPQILDQLAAKFAEVNDNIWPRPENTKSYDAHTWLGRMLGIHEPNIQAHVKKLRAKDQKDREQYKSLTPEEREQDKSA